MPNAPTGQQAYALIQATYGLPLKAESFTHVLVDGYGNADFLACHLVEWVLDWYRPAADGGPRFRGSLELPSRWLASQWHVNDRMFRRARERVAKAGLITWKTVRHTCTITVNWDSVRAVIECRKLELDPDFRLTERSQSKFRLTEGSQSKRLDRPKGVSLNGLDRPKGVNITSLTSSPPSSSLEAHEDAYDETEEARKPMQGREEGRKIKEMINDNDTLTSSAPPADSAQDQGDALAIRAVRLLDQATTLGRPCEGEWRRQAVAAYASAVMEGGTDPDLIDAAYLTYLRGLGEGRAGKADTLWHWLRGTDLKGTPRDTPPRDRYIAAAQAAKARREEMARGRLDRSRDKGVAVWHLIDQKHPAGTLIAEARGIEDEESVWQIVNRMRATYAL